jgi:hypothetical protein
MWSLLAKTGLVSDGSQPPLDCAWPNKKIDRLEDCDAMSEVQFAQCMTLVNDKEWQHVPSVTDPDPNGDMKFYSKPQIGSYHFVKITMTLMKTTPEDVLDLALSEDAESRKQFSVNIDSLEVAGKTENTTLYHVSYTAAPGVAPRDFVLLQGIKQLGNGAMAGFGASVGYDKYPEATMTVRGSCQYLWHVTPEGNNVKVVFCNCFDPRGWCPPFVLAWLKSTATQEFVNIRQVLAGSAANLKATSLDSIGFSQDEIDKQKAEKQ